MKVHRVDELVIQCKNCRGWTEFTKDRSKFLAYTDVVCQHCGSDRVDGSTMRSARTHGLREVKVRKVKENPINYKGDKWF